jgi:hypothetical protein
MWSSQAMTVIILLGFHIYYVPGYQSSTVPTPKPMTLEPWLIVLRIQQHHCFSPDLSRTEILHRNYHTTQALIFAIENCGFQESIFPKYCQSFPDIGSLSRIYPISHTKPLSKSALLLISRVLTHISNNLRLLQQDAVHSHTLQIAFSTREANDQNPAPRLQTFQALTHQPDGIIHDINSFSSCSKF